MTSPTNDGGSGRRRTRRSLFSLRLRGKLALVAAAATAAVLATTAWLTIRLFREHLLEATVQANSNESDALRVVLEEQMLAGDRTLLRRLVLPLHML